MLRPTTTAALRSIPRLVRPSTVTMASSSSATSHCTIKGTPDACAAALAGNRRWATAMQEKHAAVLADMAAGQKPPIFWIGCSDSRVPETTVLDCEPGDVFVHRNIANIVTAGDASAGAALDFAVGHLGVEHVVLCGHSSCGGVKGALGNGPLGGRLDSWLAPLRQIRGAKAREWAALTDAQRVDALVRENVRAGVRTIREHPVVIAAMRERGLKVHGMVFDLAKGQLEEVDVVETDEEAKLRVEAFQLH